MVIYIQLTLHPQAAGFIAKMYKKITKHMIINKACVDDFNDNQGSYC